MDLHGNPDLAKILHVGPQHPLPQAYLRLSAKDFPQNPLPAQGFEPTRHLADVSFTGEFSFALNMTYLDSLWFTPYVMAAGDISPATLSVREQLLSANSKPVDAPEFKDIYRNSPLDVMRAAKAIAAEQGNAQDVLMVLVHTLAAEDLRPTTKEQRSSKKATVTPNPWLAALTSAFFAPDINDAVALIYSRLTMEWTLQKQPVQRLTPDGRAMPRKRDVLPDGQLMSRAMDPATSNGQELQTMARVRERYPRFLFALGEHYFLQNSQVNGYECMARGILLDFDAWNKVSSQYYEAFLDSASFMVLSAHKTDDVMALYAQVPLPLDDLQRLIVDQIERRTQIYTNARTEFTNNAAISQALGDLLNTLIEDPSIDELLPQADKRRFLALVGEAALSRRNYQEAIGVFSALDDRSKLSQIGQQLSSRIYYLNQGTVAINRDIEVAIDAFREAGDTAAMKNLLSRCDDVRLQLEREGAEVANINYLDRYINILRSSVDQSYVSMSLGLSRRVGISPMADASAVPPDISEERLETLIAAQLDLLSKTVAGQDVEATKNQLRRLGEQAILLGATPLVIQAYRALEPDGTQRLLDLARLLVADRRYSEAIAVYKVVGTTAESALVQLGLKILTDGIVVRGMFNPEVEMAVEAYLLLSESDRTESLFNDLLKVRSQFIVTDRNLEASGRIPPNRNQEILDRCIRRIAEEYDVPYVIPPVTPPKKSGETPVNTGVTGKSTSPKMGETHERVESGKHDAPAPGLVPNFPADSSKVVPTTSSEASHGPRTNSALPVILSPESAKTTSLSPQVPGVLIETAATLPTAPPPLKDPFPKSPALDPPSPAPPDPQIFGASVLSTSIHAGTTSVSDDESRLDPTNQAAEDTEDRLLPDEYRKHESPAPTSIYRSNIEP